MAFPFLGRGEAGEQIPAPKLACGAAGKVGQGRRKGVCASRREERRLLRGKIRNLEGFNQFIYIRDEEEIIIETEIKSDEHNQRSKQIQIIHI